MEWFIEYDWTFCCYRIRLNGTFSDFRGIRSTESLDEWREILAPHGWKIGRKTDSRTWRIVTPG